MNLEIGSTVGDYQVVGILGAGGMRKVYKVRNVISDRVEAMKVLLPDLVNSPTWPTRFLRSQSAGQPGASEHRRAAHGGARGKSAPHADGVRRRRHAGSKAQGWAAAGRRGGELHHAGVGGARLRGHSCRGASRDQDGQHDADAGGRGEAVVRHRALFRRPQAPQTGPRSGPLYVPEQIQVSPRRMRVRICTRWGLALPTGDGQAAFDGNQFAIMSAHLQGTPVPPVTIDPRLPPCSMT